MKSLFRARVGVSLATFGLFFVPAMPFIIAPCPAVAQSSSLLSGVALPKGAERFGKADKNFRDFLADLAKQPGVRRDLRGGVETFVLSGANYREDRVPFVKNAFARSLSEAGYAVRPITDDDIHHLNTFAHFDLNDDDLAFKPSLGKMETYFLADNAARGQSLIGVWLESDGALALSLVPVNFVGKAVPKALPPLPAGAVLVTNPRNTAGSLPPLPTPRFPALTRKARAVRGYVYDGGGKPLAGAEVSAYSSLGGGIRTTHTARTNAAGMYEIPLPAGVAEIADAKAHVTYNGVEYDLALTPVGGKAKGFNSVSGQVQNFYLQTAGGGGGTIRIVTNTRPGILEVTLKPVGRALDGSSRSFVYRIPADKDIEVYLRGIPIGRYTLTAQILEDGEALPLRTHRLGHSFDTATPSMEVNFLPGYERSEGDASETNGTVPFALGLVP